jgi:hypothetical protein
VLTHIVYGFTPPKQTKNTGNMGTGTRPPEKEIYRTEDEEEAKKLVANGGFVDEQDVWHVATRYVSSDPINATGVGERAISKDAPAPGDGPGVPNNSSATLDERTGQVRTDKGKRPMTQEDVEAQAVAGAPIMDPLKKPRNIIN